MTNFIWVWSVAIASACYSYMLTRIFHVRKGILRLISILPVLYLFIVLPFSISSVHLCPIATGYLTSLGTFKLILYSFDLGPLSAHPNKSLLHFVCIALLPIIVKGEPRSSSNAPNEECPPHGSKIKGDPDGQINQGRSSGKRTTKVVLVLLGRFVLFCVKLLAIPLLLIIHEYREKLPSFVMLANFYCLVYLVVEITLAISVVLVQPTLGLELGPQFNEPFLATSLQDFWGRRWNLVISDILQLSVYNPLCRVTTPLVGKRWGKVCGTPLAFTVSGFMHELIFFYLTHVWPTWEVTCFFDHHRGSG